MNDYALVVGIDRYKGGNLKPLRGAANDAAAFTKWLLEKANVDEGNVECLVSDADGEKPKLTEIVDLVKKIYKLSANGEQRIGRRLYIFLAGHGVGPSLDEAALLAADTTDDTPEYFPGRTYANLFRGQALFEEVVLCMDCCRDWDPELPDPYYPFKKKTAGGAASRVKKCYVFATGFGRKSRERDFDGKVRGVFSRALIDGLEGRAVDGEGRLTGASLKRFLRQEMAKLQAEGSDEPPDLSGIDDDIVFAEGLPPKLVPVTLELSDPGKNLVILYGKGLKPVAANVVDLGGNRRQVELPAGKTYLFRLINADGTTYRENGETVDHEAPDVVQL